MSNSLFSFSIEILIQGVIFLFNIAICFWQISFFSSGPQIRLLVPDETNLTSSDLLLRRSKTIATTDIQFIKLHSDKSIILNLTNTTLGLAYLKCVQNTYYFPIKCWLSHVMCWLLQSEKQNSGKGASCLSSQHMADRKLQLAAAAQHHRPRKYQNLKYSSTEYVLFSQHCKVKKSWVEPKYLYILLLHLYIGYTEKWIFVSWIIYSSISVSKG